MEYVLQTNSLEKKYRDSKVLNNLNMHVEKGAIYGLVGKNGAGKTTLIRIVCGLQNPTSGDYTLYGANSWSGDVSAVRKRVGAIIESPSIYGEFSARDNLILQCKVVGLPDYDSVDEILELVGLSDVGRKHAKHFSLGMKQRLGIAIALVGNPDFLILDEPINGLDPQGIIDIRELILKLNKEKSITILISSHYLDELSKIATHYGFLDSGSIIKEISQEELMKKMEHKIELEVSNQKEFVKYFEEKNYSYEVVSKSTINVYGKHNLAKFINELASRGLIADNVREIEESLENYYMNLIGGERND